MLCGSRIQLFHPRIEAAINEGAEVAGIRLGDFMATRSDAGIISGNQINMSQAL